MSDIVERLRALHDFRYPNKPAFASTYAEAADEIERLRMVCATIMDRKEKMRAAAYRIVREYDDEHSMAHEIDILRRAIEDDEYFYSARKSYKAPPHE